MTSAEMTMSPTFGAEASIPATVSRHWAHVVSELGLHSSTSRTACMELSTTKGRQGWCGSGHSQVTMTMWKLVISFLDCVSPGLAVSRSDIRANPDRRAASPKGRQLCFAVLEISYMMDFIASNHPPLIC
ncbi:MAG: hypothetical protein WBD99_06660 [Thermodesulfobacteriota bacterium]